ncbi:MAG: hypothetical protein CFE46_19215 [Burkholderiales bacterium PBB6]|nr:MAG: hypothetical protein CFE46_19215 [Burkholderiales bacterium PBB6]
MSLPPAFPTPRPPVAQPSRWWRSGLLAALMVSLVALGGIVGFRWNERAGLINLAAVANERLELYAATLEAELARFAYLPSLIAADNDVRALLDNPDNPALAERAGRTLARIGVRAGAAQVLVLDPEGSVLARSDLGSLMAGADAQRSTSSWVQLMASGDHFSRNPLDGSTDYQFVLPVQRQGKTRANVVVTVNLSPLEATWIDLGLRTQSERLLVVDERESVVMSSVPSWKYRHLQNLEPAVPRSTSTPPPTVLALQTETVLAPGATLVRAPLLGAGTTSRYLLQERTLTAVGGRMLTLSDPSEVWRQSRMAALGGAAAGALAGLLLLYVLYRRRVLRQLLQARNALQQAHDQLERQVDLRTAQLRSTNDELKRQIAQRMLAEDELLQASKLAVLGQMSTGISHEINQPLTALRALSRNGIRLLDTGRIQDAIRNLQSIDEMTERMGRIVTQLKNFARKDSPHNRPVSLAEAARNVLLMLEHRLRENQVGVMVDIADTLQALGDPTRLEQVLLNLAGNAVDAMAHSERRVLRLSAQMTQHRVLVRVDDSGPGITDEQLQRLFEPFFTTKPAGQGLGLGLVISTKIVREFGGTLRAHRLEEGMRFEFDLAPVEDPDV